jgi:uncharacterized protein (TIGR02145 family)
MKKVLKLLVLTFFAGCMTSFISCKKDAENPPVTVPVVTTSAVSMIATTSAETGGNVTSTGGAEVISRGVCWSTVHNPTITDNKTTDGNGSGTFASIITDLTPNTTYYVRAYATNSSGIAYGSEISFKSNPVVVGLATLTTDVVTSITYAYAVSGGNVTDDGGENLAEIGICWGTAVNPTTNDSKTQYLPVARNFISSMDNLKPSTKYYVRAYAINSAGTAYGNELSFTTTSVTPVIFNPDLTYGSVSDIDGNIYKTIQIGTQLWMSENLKTTRYNDGTSVPYVPDDIEWRNLSTPGYSWYNNDGSSYEETFGALYNWQAVNTAKLCPAGWHIPTTAEWVTLTTYLGGENVAGGKIKETGTTHWLSPNIGATNETGLTGLPGGVRWSDADDTEHQFRSIGQNGSWWSATSSDPSGFGADFFSVFASGSNGLSNEPTALKTDGISVRCLKDN